MKSKKVTMLAAALVVAVVALAGVGYAAATGTFKATTVNTDNDADSAYVKATQNAWEAAFTDTGVEMYTYTDNTHGGASGNPVFALKDTGANAIHESYYGVQIGQTVTITLTEVNLANNTTYSLDIKANGGSALPTGWKYFMVVGSTAVDVSSGSATIDSVTLTNKTVDVKLYITGPKFSTIIADSGLDDYVNLGASNTYAPENNSPTLYADAKFAFIFTANSTSA